MTTQLDLFASLLGPQSNEASPEPDVQSAEVIPFPTMRNQRLVRQFAERLTPLSSEDRETVWGAYSIKLRKVRRQQGLSRDQAYADAVAFRDAVRTLVAYLETDGGLTSHQPTCGS